MKVARSGWRQTIDTLTPADIDAIVDQFAAAAGRVREAGYDGVELHSAHAYTLSSFLSRHNKRRDEYDGRTLEGRLRMFGRVMTRVRKTVGKDFPVGVRFLAEEAIKDGYGLPDSQRIALRMAQMGADYISLSVGGKFEDAVHKPGEALYPYTGYSGDRCMPGDWYPPLPHAHLAAGIKQYINEKGFNVPVVSVGKISDPADAERLLQDDRADIVGMARQLLSDPDWVRKVEERRPEKIIRCIYCNVCKQLDENFKTVTCFLWPKGVIQAPHEDLSSDAPHWPEAGAALTATVKGGAIQLAWKRAEGVGHHRLRHLPRRGRRPRRDRRGGEGAEIHRPVGARRARLQLSRRRLRQVRAAHAALQQRHHSHAPARFRLHRIWKTPMPERSAHLDTFARDNLPPLERMAADVASRCRSCSTPARMNAGVELLDKMVAAGFAERPVIWFGKQVWSYRDLLEKANRIARVLTRGLRPQARQPRDAARRQQPDDGRVLVRRAQGRRHRRRDHAAAARQGADLHPRQGEGDARALRRAPRRRDEGREGPRSGAAQDIVLFNSDASDGLEAKMAQQARRLRQLRHRDRRRGADRLHVRHNRPGQGHGAFPPRRHGDERLLPALDAEAWQGGHLLRLAAARLHLRPRRARHASRCASAPRRRWPRGRPPTCCRRSSTTARPRSCFSAPTAFRVMAESEQKDHLASLKKGVSAGEHLPLAIFEAWRDATGIKLIDGLGATEMIHIFISSEGDDIRPGATGKAIPGYEARIVDDAGNTLPPGEDRQARGARTDRLPLPRRPGAPAEVRPERLEPDRRRLQDGCRRVLLVPGPRRRHDHLGRLQHLRPRGRRRPARAPEGARMRGDRRARPRAHA